MISDGKPKPPDSISEEDAEVLRSAYDYLKYSEGAWRFPVVEQLKMMTASQNCWDLTMIKDG